MVDGLSLLQKLGLRSGPYIALTLDTPSISSDFLVHFWDILLMGFYDSFKTNVRQGTHPTDW